MNLLVTLLVGALAGWLGGLLYRGSGFGLIGNIIIGIIGSWVGSWVLGMLHVSFGAGILGAILTGATGAIVVLLLVNLIFSARK